MNLFNSALALAALCLPPVACKTDHRINTEYRGAVSFNQPKSYKFGIYDDPTQVEPGQTLRLGVTAPSASEHFPLHVTVRFRTAAQVLQIPFATEGGATHQGANLTLCPDLFLPKMSNRPKWTPIEVELSTSSVNMVKFSLLLNLQRVYNVEMKSRHSSHIEPQSPMDFRVDIPADVDYVVLSLESTDDLCMAMSSFDGNCTGSVPVQRISADRRAGMTIARERHMSGVAAVREHP